MIRPNLDFLKLFYKIDSYGLPYLILYKLDVIDQS